MADLTHVDIMGILNVTPDSFSDGGRFVSVEKAVRHAENMVKAGAAIIDIGGESTRPGADQVSLSQELDRVMPVLEKVLNVAPRVSVDTTKYEVSREAVRAGAHIINDISGLQYDDRIADLAAENGSDLVIMHMLGTPETMQKNPEYDSVIDSITIFFDEKIRLAKSRGVKDEQIILDPGIGFGKRLQDNIDIFRRLEDLSRRGHRLLMGASRKSLIRDIHGAPVDRRLAGSVILACVAALRGANILRVHDVYETAQAVSVFNAVW